VKPVLLGVCTTGAALLIGALSALGACGGTSLRGAVTEAPGRDLGGPELARFFVAGCTDRSGRAVDAAAGMEVVVFSGVSQRVVVERRRGYDSLVFTNGFDEPGRRVAQAVIDGSGGDVIRQITVPVGAPGPGSTRGSLVVAREWSEQKLDGGGFRATLGRPVMSCALEPVPAPPPPLVALPASPQDAGAPDGASPPSADAGMADSGAD
jgi:hypothetical protein